MKRPLRVLFCVCLLVAVSSLSPVGAADNQKTPTSQYSLGDQTFSINAGLFVPLFLLPTGTVFLASNPPHLSLGGAGYLSWAVYVTPEVRLGLDFVGGTFSFSPNGNALLMLPFLAKVSYSFTTYPFEIPISLGVGMNVVKYTDLTTIDLLVKPGASLFWIYNSSWSFGVNLGYWFDMQFAPDPAQSRIGSFLDISLGAFYHY